ncbi:MAG: hypothetical protein HY261_09335 [Chloroflexi bacterium]|nr:hypothetical protein [Chloroflexota bacterium]
MNDTALAAGQGTIAIVNGSVRVFPPPGLDGRYPPGTQVSLQVRPNAADSTITWSGADVTVSMDQVAITMTRDRQVKVSVTPNTFVLTINGLDVTGPVLSLGLGDVSISPPPNTRDGRYYQGTEVSLSVQPFGVGGTVRWTTAGSSAVGNTFAVTMTADRALTLVINTNSYALTINGIPVTGPILPVPGGTISISPTPNGPNGRYGPGTQVTLTAQPFSDGAIITWLGNDGAPMDNPAIVTMNSDRAINVGIS